MPFSRVGLAAAMAALMAASAPSAFAQQAATLTPAQMLAAQIEADLEVLAMQNGGMPTDEQIQLVIATDLAMSTVPLDQKEAAMTQVQAAAMAPGSALPSGTANATATAYTALTTTGTFVAAAPPAGGNSFTSTSTTTTTTTVYPAP